MEICRKIFHPSEERQLMKWVGIFQVGIFWMGIFRGGIFQGELWWVGIFRVWIFPGGIFLEPKKGLIRKIRLISKIMTLQPG